MATPFEISYDLFRFGARWQSAAPTRLGFFRDITRSPRTAYHRTPYLSPALLGLHPLGDQLELQLLKQLLVRFKIPLCIDVV